ncbi:hypothetical protein BFD57_26030 [Escherichia coli]|nr:hypothetical protein BFD57_26030 [Escherichia coli]
MASVSISCPSCSATDGVVRNGKSSDVIVCAEMDEQWGYVGAKSRQRWLFYAYDRLRKTVVAHVLGSDAQWNENSR